MGRQPVQALQVICGGQAPIQADPKLSVALVAYLAMYPATCSADSLGLLVTGDVADVELLAPTGIAIRPVLQGVAGHPDSVDGLP